MPCPCCRTSVTPTAGSGAAGGEASPEPEARSAGNEFSTGALVTGAIAFLSFPIVLGLIAIILAGIGRRRQERRAPLALTVAILATLGGLALGAIPEARLLDR